MTCQNYLFAQNNGVNFGGTTRKSSYGEEDIYNPPPFLKIVSDTCVYISGESCSFKTNSKDSIDFPVIKNKKSMGNGISSGRKEKVDTTGAFIDWHPVFKCSPKLELTNLSADTLFFLIPEQTDNVCPGKVEVIVIMVIQ